MARKPTKGGFDFTQAPGHLLRRAQQFANDLYMQEVSSSDLTPRQFTVLHAVSENEGLSQTDLVRKTGIDRSTLADMISRMIKRGLLARQRTKEDARANAVTITAAGNKALNDAMPDVKKAEDKIVAPLSATQQKAFLSALGTLAEAMDKAEAEAEAARPAAKKAATKKAPAKKAAKKKAPAKKAAKKKAPAKKAAKKKAPAKKAAKKAPAKKAPAKKAAAKKAPAKKAAKKKAAKKK